MERSLIEYAYDYVSGKKTSSSFKDIWAYVVKEAGLTDEEAAARVSKFYTNLMLDGRFVTLGENEWDLRVRHTFDKVHIDMKDVYSDVESSDEDQEEQEEENEYNAVLDEPQPTEVGDDEALAPETTDDDEEQTL